MKYIKRQIEEKVARHLKVREMTILLGPRQVGKTVLLEQLQKRLEKKENISADRIFYYNLDIIKDWELVRNQTQFIEFLKSRSKNKKIYVFIDEAQRVENPGLFFKGLYDSKLNVKFILTGSASLEFASKVKESLAGRKRIFFLYPFSFFEFLSAKNKKLAHLLSADTKFSEYDSQELNKLFREYVVWGGYPRVVLGEGAEDKQVVLADIYSSYIERDIVGFLQIKNKAKFNKLVSLLAGQIGQLVNIDELAVNVELDRDTVYRYLTALEETYILAILRPYFKNARQEIVKNPKLYFIDNGIRNYLLDDFKYLSARQDKGALFENSIFKELFVLRQKKRFSLHFWRTKQGPEVDFIFEKGKTLTPIEAKLKYNKNPSAGLSGFIKKYKPKQAFVITLMSGKKEKKEKAPISVIYPHQLAKHLLK